MTILTLSSCKQDKKDVIAKKWRASKLDNAQMEQMVKEQSDFIDTFGMHTDAATNQDLYGVRNVDSVRTVMKQQLTEYKAMQESAVKNTWFDFRKNGKVILNFSGHTDSANWELEKDGTLVIDEKKLKGTGNVLKMEVLALSEDTLKLRFNEEGMTSTVTFLPDKK